MDHAELRDWLRLSLSEGLGNQSARKLLGGFGLPHNIFAQSENALRQIVGSAQAAALAQEPEQLEALADATWQWLQGDLEGGAPTRHIVTLGDPRYPASLLEIADPPLLLYMQGSFEAGLPDVLASCIAIVGSRNPTPQGAVNAREFAKALTHAGLVVVSGLALGVDGAAHQGALDAADEASGRPATVAVVGTGLDVLYPKSHAGLTRAIRERGLVISEYALGTPPLSNNFPRRNRLIAGLCRGTLVVEAALQSGSLITARLAAEQGRDVFAIPGSIHSAQSRGCHLLIKQGVKLVESANDILDEWHWPASLAAHPATAQEASAAGSEAALERALGFEPVGLDALLARTGLATADLQAQLMQLELQGQVVRLPGGLFQRIARA
ncbi:MAG: DNA-processing protein DprA [Burkholderiaceae bacterium]